MSRNKHNNGCGPVSEVEKIQMLVLEALERNDRHTARKHLRKGLKILQKSGDKLREAEFHFALGLSYLRVEGSDARRIALDELLQAASIALDLSNQSLFLKSLDYLCEAIQSSSDLTILENLVSKASELLSSEGHSEATRALAKAKTFLALKDSFKGLDLTSPDALIDEESVKKLIEEGIISDGYLHLLYAAQAQARGDLGLAEKEAQAARQAALEAVDPFLYVLACGSIARLCDEAGDRVGALSILFTCRASIADLLGEVAGELVVPMIEALKQRWGSEAFFEALSKYRSQFREGEPCKNPLRQEQ